MRVGATGFGLGRSKDAQAHREPVSSYFEWSELSKVRKAHGPTRVLAVRPLAPDFHGISVEILCRDPSNAVDLVVDWCRMAQRPSG